MIQMTDTKYFHLKPECLVALKVTISYKGQSNCQVSPNITVGKRHQNFVTMTLTIVHYTNLLARPLTMFKSNSILSKTHINTVCSSAIGWMKIIAKSNILIQIHIHILKKKNIKRVERLNLTGWDGWIKESSILLLQQHPHAPSLHEITRVRLVYL